MLPSIHHFPIRHAQFKGCGLKKLSDSIFDNYLQPKTTFQTSCFGVWMLSFPKDINLNGLAEVLGMR